MDADFIPTRLCCGQKHLGPQCPDGKVMCCMCFARFEISELSTDKESGKKCDVCIECQNKEDVFMAKLNLTDEEAQELYRQWRIYHGEPVDENGESDCPDIPPVGIRAFQWGIAYQKQIHGDATNPIRSKPIQPTPKCSSGT